ncbi:hypothetical protein E8E11_009062 [Didymella keratinophila]|nr:hypothetical protein E8E11_009062 [Didymella keratinophila]
MLFALASHSVREAGALPLAFLLGFTSSSTARARLRFPQAPSRRRWITIASPLAMFGIGPMLPVIPAAEKCDRSSNKVQKSKSKRDPSAASHELTIMRRPSTIKTESTLFEDNVEYAVQQPSPTPHHQRDLSLIVDFDLDHAAAQLNNGEISDLDLALFAFWIKAKHDNYLMAKGLVRELALDQGYNVDKITDPRVRKLLQEVHDVRPS